MPPCVDHEPVMLKEVVELFADIPQGLVVDATAGTGGHALAILESRLDLRVLCLDRDPEAVGRAEERLARFGTRALVRHARFDALAIEATRAGSPPGTLSGILFDLGVSSLQLDTARRGFSYWHEGPLDMRMDLRDHLTAAEVVNEWDASRLSRLIAENGEGRFARRIARAIVARRPIGTTTELAGIVRDAIPAATRRTGGHPARRVFQALRVAVNDEMEVLARAVPLAIDSLAPRGRCVTLAYHSGEDRIVKTAFAAAVSGGCICPPAMGCVCGARSLGRLVFRGSRKPTAAEVARNARAHSARLRAFERTSETAAGEPSVPGSSGGEAL